MKIEDFYRHLAMRLLKTSAVSMIVRTDRGTLRLDVGPQLRPAMDVEIGDEDISFTATFSGRVERVTVPWAAVLMVRPLLSPGPGPESPAGALNSNRPAEPEAKAA